MEREDFVKQFKVGDNVTLDRWPNAEKEEIAAIGEKHFLSKDDDGIESKRPIEENWIPYKEEKKMIKIYQYAYYDGCIYRTYGNIDNPFFKDDDDFAGITFKNKFKRLDYTETEVEDY